MSAERAVDPQSPQSFSQESAPMSQSPMSSNGIVPSQSARIEVIGVGGGGSNAVNRMIASDLKGVGYRVLNTAYLNWRRGAEGRRAY